MKWYSLAHLAAVTMSCFCAELQALQLLFLNSASGIARALPSFLLYILKFTGLKMSVFSVAFRQLKSFSTMSRGKHKLCTYWAGMAKSRWAGTPSYIKTTDLSISIFSSPVPEKNQHSTCIHYSSSCRGKHLIGDIAMVIVKFCPRWPHT